MTPEERAELIDQTLEQLSDLPGCWRLVFGQGPEGAGNSDKARKVLEIFAEKLTAAPQPLPDCDCGEASHDLACHASDCHARADRE